MSQRVGLICKHLAGGGSGKTPSEDQALPQTSSVCAVTGASGYVGSWLCRLLLNKGHSVRACVRDQNNAVKSGFLKEWPEYASGQLVVYSADMTKPGQYDAIFEGAVVVFHPAEVFMSFSDGRDYRKAKADFGEVKPKLANLNKAAMASSQYVVDSINKSSTVRRLIYTSSMASMSPGTWQGRYNLDESREPNEKVFGAHSYAITKRATEHFFAYHAMLSGGKWSVLIGNPGDIIGPIQSPHQAAETWQGKVAGVLRGNPIPQEPQGRPWYCVDVRDVAAAEIKLAESSSFPSGSRVMLAAGDIVPPENISARVVELFPEYEGRLGAGLAHGAHAKEVERNRPFWQRVHINNAKARVELGYAFRSWDDTLQATVRSLVTVGAVNVPAPPV